jgi:hypothetical protein
VNEQEGVTVHPVLTELRLRILSVELATKCTGMGGIVAERIDEIYQYITLGCVGVPKGKNDCH